MSANHPKTDKIIRNYLDKHLPDYVPAIEPAHDLALIVVIPVYREKDYIFRTIASLQQCINPQKNVEVVLLFNASESAPESVVEEQKETAQMVCTACFDSPVWLKFLVEENYAIPKKHFGAGMARKAGMDIALARLFAVGNSNGLIVTLDADSQVTPNYFVEILKWFIFAKRNGATVYFEHPLSGNEFSPEVYDGIIQYELHLRYYLQALRQTGFPYAFHTMGSAMVMRASAYARAGGMVRKQAGEDFYFLQKLIPLGNFGEMHTTTVIPSPRPSERVIFGTGAAITKHLAGSNETALTYNYRAFADLKTFFDLRHELFNTDSILFEQWSLQLAEPLRHFLLNTNFITDVETLKRECSSVEIFGKRFFELFNAFKVVKYLNCVHEKFYAKTSVIKAAQSYIGHDTEATAKWLLQEFRDIEKRNVFYFTEITWNRV
ncbi:MAG: glycosyltransferase [Cytophagaceae bacterium]|jgi:glycosyltransferase involved in cell wall biosynthesis|nr:glycosyltransferase [Cytophagaceae bacterium]